MNDGWNVIIKYDESFASLDIWFVKKNQDGSEDVVLPINLTLLHRLLPREMRPEPTLRLAQSEAVQFLQGLANALATSGFIPDAAKANNKQLEALSNHLEDMRKLVFEALLPLNIPPPLIGQSQRVRGE